MPNDDPAVNMIVSKSDLQTQRLGFLLGEHVIAGDVVSIIGDLGAGKTNFVKGVADAMGIDDCISSPTFNLVNAYGTGSVPLYHFDLYRLDDAAQLEDIDFYALADSDSDGVSFIEWADMFTSELPEDRLDVVIKHDATDENARIIMVNPFGSRATELSTLWFGAIEHDASDCK